MCVRGTTGVVSLASEELKDANVTRGIVPLFFDSHQKLFIYHQLKSASIQQIISEKTYGIALKQINLKELRVIKLITPPIVLQTQFAQKIEHIEKQKALIERSITDVQQLFDYTMDRYFS